VKEETKAVGQVQATPPATEGNTVAAANVGGSDGTEPAVANQDDTIRPERWRCEFPHLFPPLSMAELAARQAISASYRCRSGIATHSSPLDIYTTMRVS
jgi:hypothetical protein